MTTIYLHKTAANAERRAARELRDAGIGDILPLDTSGPRARVTAPGYVGADGVFSSPFAQHVKRCIGEVRLADMMRLFVFPQERRAEQGCPFEIGQRVLIGEVPAKVVEIRGRICRVAFDMAGKTHMQSIAYAKLKPG